MKKILITGADGFIGSHLTELLLEKKFKVTAIVYYNSLGSFGWLSNIDDKYKRKIKIVFGDINDEIFIDNLIKNNDVIINLAALIGIPYSYVAPNSYFKTNILGLVNILNSSLKYKKKLIHTSTSEVYGTPKKIPINENANLNAQSPYAASKIAADQIALSYHKSFDLKLNIIRPFNTFGPRQSLRAVIPTIITQCLDENCKIIKLGNLNTLRNFNYIKDTIEAFHKVIKKNVWDGNVVNIGSNSSFSINETVKMIQSLTKTDKKIMRDNKRVRPSKSEVQLLSADNKLARKILNWKPNFVGKEGFKKGLKETVEWFKKNKKIINYKKDYTI
tara:strand:- start:117 stop:1112 length:996 start_codon:yes stop_codon:yes gene_type:complete